MGDEREDQRGHKGGAHLERGVLETFDMWRSLAGNDHQRVAEGRGDAAHDACDGHIAAEALGRDEEGAAGAAINPAILPPVSFSPK
ncbi:MAG: hypothetical protein ACLU37_03790 [Collinsella sp.]